MKNVHNLKIIKSFKSFCRNKDIERAYQFLLNNKDAIYKDYLSSKGINLLIISITQLGPVATPERDNFLNLIKLLIDIKVDVNFVSKSPYHSTSLWEAIVLGRKNAATANRLTQLLLENNADVNLIHPRDENSPLMQAGCDLTDINVYKLILSKTKKEYINARGPQDYYNGPLGMHTPAHWACYGARLDFMNALLATGGDFVIQDIDDCTAVEGALNLDENKPVANANTTVFNIFLSQNPSIIEKELERMESMKNDKESTFLTCSNYEAHKKYHDYIISLKQKLNLEKSLQIPNLQLKIKNKI